MPVARPAYGRKPGPSVVPPAPPSKKDAARAKADQAARDAVAVAVSAVMTSIG